MTAAPGWVIGLALGLVVALVAVTVWQWTVSSGGGDDTRGADTPSGSTPSSATGPAPESGPSSTQGPSDQTDDSGGPSGAGQDQGGGPGESTPAEPRRDPRLIAQRRAVRTCVAELRAGRLAAVAARRGIYDWRAHLAVRALIRTGKSNPARATAIQAATARRAPRAVRQTLYRLRDYDRARGGCADVRERDDLGAGLQFACYWQSARTQRAVQQGTAGMTRWTVQLLDEVAVSQGTLSLRRAEKRFVRAWDVSPRVVLAFERTMLAMKLGPQCTVPDAPWDDAADSRGGGQDDDPVGSRGEDKGQSAGQGQGTGTGQGQGTGDDRSRGDAGPRGDRARGSGRSVR